jgi:sugar/nucleoside kinase (ribokinase family)
MPAFDVSVIGELNLDVILYGLPPNLVPEREHLAQNLNITLGSSSAIFAHNLSLLGNKVGFNSCIGDDPLGGICVDRLSASGVDVTGVRTLCGQTTGLTVILPLTKDRYILTYPGTMYSMTAKHLHLDHVFNAKHLHIASYFLLKGISPDLPELFRRAKQLGLTISLDTNDDPADLWSSDLQALFPHLDVLLLNERELCKIAQNTDLDQAIESIAKRVALLVVKRGSQSALARIGRNTFSAAPPVVEIIDSVGAGDSFDAGFIHAFMRGQNTEACLRSGNLAAALSVTRPGGTEAFRDHAYRKKFLQEHSVA